MLTTPPPVPPPTARKLLNNPEAFVKSLHAAWKRCQQVHREQGISQRAVGYAFYQALTELFERSDLSEADRDAQEKETDQLIPPKAIRDALDRLEDAGS